VCVVSAVFYQQNNVNYNQLQLLSSAATSERAILTYLLVPIRVSATNLLPYQSAYPPIIQRRLQCILRVPDRPIFLACSSADPVTTFLPSRRDFSRQRVLDCFHHIGGSACLCQRYEINLVNLAVLSVLSASTVFHEQESGHFSL